MPMGEENKHWMESDGTAQARIAQVKALKAQAAEGGLRFEAFLVSSQAICILELVERDAFVQFWHDPQRAFYFKPNESINSDIDKIICLGDNFSLGASPAEVLQKLQELPNTIFIRGNHDDPEECRRNSRYLGEFGIIGDDW